MSENVVIRFYLKSEKYNEEQMKKVIDVIMNFNVEFREETYIYPLDNPVKGKVINNFTLDNAVQMAAKHGSSIPFLLKNKFAFDFHIFTHREGLGYISLKAPYSEFDPHQRAMIELTIETKEKNALKKSKALLELAKSLWATMNHTPLFGVGDDDAYFSADELEQLLVKNQIKNLIGSNWLYFFGPEVIALLGREKILHAPAYKIEEIKNGILLMNSPLPYHYNLDRTISTAEKVKKYFGDKSEK